MKTPTSTQTPQWLLPDIPFTTKLKYYLQNLCMFTYKIIVINFKITNFKNKFTIKTKILLLANTDQTLQT